jgi:hypothetical protein
MELKIEIVLAFIEIVVSDLTYNLLPGGEDVTVSLTLVRVK